MPEPAVEPGRSALVTEEIRQHFPQWKLQRLERIARGLEALIFRAETDAFGVLALKVPLARMVHNDNDQGLDSRDLLRQEWDLLGHLQGLGLPAAERVALHVAGRAGGDFLAYRFVEVDGSIADPREMGRLLRRLHDAAPPGRLPVAHRGEPDAARVAAELLVARGAALQRLTGRALRLPPAEVLRQALTRSGAPRRLLHMDMRPDNLLSRDGRMVAVIDWSNALLGDPLLEMARVAEYGLPFDSVCDGYGRDLLAEAPPASATMARLYTAAMLAVVFVSEAPDASKAARALRRLEQLLEQFSHLSPA